MKLKKRNERKARIEIIPMIDVIFFLLVFFMITSLSMTKINSMPVALPKTSAAPTAIKQNIILTVKKSGEMYVNKMVVTVESLEEMLALAMHDSPQDTIVVNADEGANYGLVVQAMDHARRIGVRKFALATDAGS